MGVVTIKEVFKNDAFATLQIVLEAPKKRKILNSVEVNT
jgi:hypothetical protein